MHPDHGQDDAQDQIGDQLPRRGELLDVGFEDRVPTGERCIHHVGHDGRHDGRDQGLGLVVVLRVQNLDGEEGGAERRPEHATHPGRHPADDEDPAIERRQAEQLRQIGGEPGADVGHRSFSARRTSRADGQRRGDQLDRDDARAQDRALSVIGVDDRVGAVTLGLGSEGLSRSSRPEDPRPGGRAAAATDVPEGASRPDRSRRVRAPRTRPPGVGAPRPRRRPPR